MTGLPNRALLDDRLSQALAAGRRVGGLVGVLFVDLDHFKVVNDSLGHPAGDEVLRAVAARLREAVPESDTVARFGGDEFVVVSSGLRDDGDATRIADRLLAALDGPIAIGGEEQHVRASIGVCVADPRTHTDHATLLRDADTAMHRAKERGRGRYELLDEATRRRARERLTVENELRRGLELGEVQPFFQPLVRLRDGSAYGAEALVRWQHPVRGPLGPGAFLDVAEHSGLIVPLGASILREACMHAARWNAEREEPLALTVNLSPRQLVDPDLVGTVSEALAAGNLDPRQLGLEITEQALMRDEQQVLDTLTALKQLGVQLLLDDFGTGFSSLSHLKRFPIDAVKIDRSFVAGLGDDGGEDAAIVSAILAMSWATGKRVVAEGIETSEHVARLCRLRCELGQGYHFAEPLAPADFEAWLAAGAARTGCCADEEPRAQTAPFGAGESFAGAARRLVSMLHHRLPGSAVWIGRLHDVAGVVRIVAADGDSSFGLDAGTELPLEGRPETVGGRPVGSFVGQPLTVDGRTVGSIGAISRERNAFAEQDAELLAVAAAALAGHLAALARGCAPASEPLTDAVARA